ncbi:uncharacterized protein MELLADRAFT_90932 [Melampsora larici-populina 98AG31]|uniref:Tet-like 2OG-Fe(II) oxygenase domain-containing protein n=1 Tax=Melampsora larici-populina (strain 98AG31 / pathotype 3-4-7) TaxID=747676 RepID=F4R833_MELLP|nr:uncharacterized protein MELLADRAFT_90932 [Melampsora larici-populina 98AG31]EGG11426.1 hypothetical protein MELLADRAFT_90932 [Melampsora larici-populina 98AG31]
MLFNYLDQSATTKKELIVNTTTLSKKCKRSVTTNGALVHGQMHCFGQTVGYSRDILISPYTPTKGSSESLYKEFLDRLPAFGARIGRRFKSFCDEGFLVARQQLNLLQAPSMASTSKYQPSGPLDFVTNFAFTLGNFYNKPHTDNEKGKVYCLWYPIDSLSGQIVTQSEGFELEGGWFIFPEFRVAINFGGKGAVQIAWNREKVHYTRLGCSSQITYKIAQAPTPQSATDWGLFYINSEWWSLHLSVIEDQGPLGPLPFGAAPHWPFLLRETEGPGLGKWRSHASSWFS